MLCCLNFLKCYYLSKCLLLRLCLYPIKRLFWLANLALLAMLFSPHSFAQLDNLWEKKGDHWVLDTDALRYHTLTVHQESQITLPHPDGSFQRYEMQRIHVSDYALEQGIHTFTLHTLNSQLGPKAILRAGRLSIFHGKLKAYIETIDESIYIEPSTNNDTAAPLYRRFSRERSKQERIFNALAKAINKSNDSPNNSASNANKSTNDEHFNCLTDDPNHEHITGNKDFSFKRGFLSNKGETAEKSTSTTLAKKQFGSQLHTYRLALAATHEYNVRVGSGNKSSTYAEMVHAISRVNAIFERDFAIRLQLVSSENLIASTSASYSEGNVVEMLSQNQRRVDQIIGFNNYDIGHVLGVSGGGIASLASACSSRKAQGVSASAAPTSSIFYVDYLAHELAHQLSATHTFNADGDQSGVCQGNRVESGNGIFQSSSYEVGSGSTIMSYAGLCSQQNIQYSADDYFHAKSIEQVRNFSEGKYSSYNGSCGSYTNTNNAPPTVSAGEAYTIPTGTPFLLTANGSDIDNNRSAITYTWEQYDLGGYTTDRDDMHSDKGIGPLIRSVKGTTNPSRSIPSTSDILLGKFIRTHGIRLPTVSRDLNFRVTARSGAYGVDQDNVKIKVFRTEHPFAIVQPNDSVTLMSNHETTVSWITGYTEQAPVSCSHVDIELSSDSGSSFPYMLANNTPNDGLQKVRLPNISTYAARIKISCSNNIFFSLSDTSFSIQPASKPALTLSANNHRLNEGNSNDANPIFSYTIKMSTPLAQDIRIYYAVENAGKHINYAGVVDSNVINHEDFPSVNSGLPKGSVVLKAGETSKNFSLEVSADNTDEFDEYFQVTLEETPHTDFATHHALTVIISEEKPEYMRASASNQAESKPKARDLSSGSLSWFTLFMGGGLLFWRNRKS